MWLLKTGPWPANHAFNLELHQREDISAPYAILSHTWGKLKDEILFEDLARYCDPEIRQTEGYFSVDFRQGPGANLRHRAGWRKIEAAIKQARADGIGWLWADTCCIDKGSSAELSEAINSMYAWYEAAAICYAFLADVSSNDPDEVRRESFYGSRWFLRGWTLQELIAPKTVIFYSSEWKPLGNKRSLAVALTTITKIDQTILDGTIPIDSASIAQRMSWAAERKTTRAEDRAYSLMGLFRVNMPMLYGEGERAFQRLQQEIMKLSDDQSIFCWIDPRHSGDTRHGLLADSPDAFRHASMYQSYSSLDELKPFDMSNRGLSIHLPLTATDEPDIYVAALHCPVPRTNDGFLGIYLQKIASGERQYARIRSDQLVSIASRGDWRDLYVRTSFQQQNEEINMPTHCFVLNRIGSTTPGVRYNIVNARGIKIDPSNVPFYKNMVASNQNKFLNLQTTFKMIKSTGKLAAALRLRREDGEMVIVLLGARTELHPGFDIVECDPTEPRSFEELEGHFNPEPMGNTLGLRYHHVTVQAETRIRFGVKVYLIDIFVKGEPKVEEEESVEQLNGVKKDTTNRLSRMKTLFSN